jgi:hypothetical protein
MSRLVPGLALLGSLVAPAAARGQGGDAPAAIFAIIVGANRSVDPDLKPLLYADDDAARYQLLFRSLGARSILLTRPDDNTARVLPGAIVSSAPPTRQALDQAVATLGEEVRLARAHGRHTALYFLFAGHGNSDEGRAYLTLEDARLTGEDLDREVLRRVGAHESHVIVDACYSYFLAQRRGPGGRSRMVRGFSASAAGLSPEVGLLLSTSSARESHEWDGFQAGVFSHEVRSGLHGAADVDGDGRISYREIAAFVVRANAAIPNERLRPDVFARPPAGSAELLDLRRGLGRTVVVDPEAPAGHYLLEDSAGNRLLDFHRAPQLPVRLIRPGHDLAFLRHVQSGTEYQVEGAEPEVHIARLTPKLTPARTRGAAHHAFNLLFSLPFDQQAVAGYRFVDINITVSLRDEPPPPARPAWRRGSAIGLLVIAGAAAVGSGFQVVDSRRLADRAARASQEQVPGINRDIENRRTQAKWLAAGALVGAAGGLLLGWWPSPPAVPSVAAAGAHPVFGVEGRF